MKKTEMLKKNYEFKEVLSKGKYYSGSYIEAFIQNKKSNSNKNYLGIAISVKVAKAVKRNHIKRLIRENYRQYEEKIKTGNRMIFLWKKKRNPKEANYKKIKKDMENILDKANLFIEEKAWKNYLYG